MSNFLFESMDSSMPNSEEPMSRASFFDDEISNLYNLPQKNTKVLQKSPATQSSKTSVAVPSAFEQRLAASDHTFNSDSLFIIDDFTNTHSSGLIEAPAATVRPADLYLTHKDSIAMADAQSSATTLELFSNAQLMENNRAQSENADNNLPNEETAFHDEATDSAAQLAIDSQAGDEEMPSLSDLEAELEREEEEEEAIAEEQMRSSEMNNAELVISPRVGVGSGEEPANEQPAVQEVESISHGPAQEARTPVDHVEVQKNIELKPPAQAFKPSEPNTCPCEGLTQPAEPAVLDDSEDSEHERDTRKQKSLRPPMKRLVVMPKKYHHEYPINFYSLAHHVVLDGAELDYDVLCLHLGLNANIGAGLARGIRAHLRIPGNSLRLDVDNMDECKIKVVKMAHQLLYDHNLGRDFLDRPARGLKRKGCKRVRWSSDSTEVLLEFSNLLYKIALEEMCRKKYMKKQSKVDGTPAGAVEDYTSPQYVASSTAQGNLGPSQGQNNKRKANDQNMTGDSGTKRNKSANSRASQRLSASGLMVDAEDIIDLTRESDDVSTSVPVVPQGQQPLQYYDSANAATGISEPRAIPSQQLGNRSGYPIAPESGTALNDTQNSSALYDYTTPLNIDMGQQASFLSGQSHPFQSNQAGVFAPSSVADSHAPWMFPKQNSFAPDAPFDLDTDQWQRQVQPQHQPMQHQSSNEGQPDQWHVQGPTWVNPAQPRSYQPSTQYIHEFDMMPYQQLLDPAVWAQYQQKNEAQKQNQYPYNGFSMGSEPQWVAPQEVPRYQHQNGVQEQNSMASAHQSFGHLYSQYAHGFGMESDQQWLANQQVPQFQHHNRLYSQQGTDAPQFNKNNMGGSRLHMHKMYNVPGPVPHQSYFPQYPQRRAVPMGQANGGFAAY